MKRRRFATILSLFLVASLILSACTGSKKEDPSPPPASDKPADGQPAPQAPKGPAVGGELVYHVPDDPDTLAFYWASSSYAVTITDKVFDSGLGLMMVNPHTLQPEPWLAEAMPQLSDDKKTYTFKLRKGIKYHDGVELKAPDIALAYQILMSDEYQGRSKSVVAPLESVTAPDDNTVVFKTKDVFAPFLFTVPLLAPLPSHKIGNVPVKEMAAHDFWKSPIGIGPWKFVEWKPGQHTILERNDNYWAKDKAGYPLVADASKNGSHGPWFDRIRIRVIPEKNTALAALEGGELTYFDSMEPNEVDRLKAEKKDQLAAFDWDRMGYGYQTFNLEKFPTNIVEVRQALSHGLNRDNIIKGVLDNKASLPAGFVPPIHWVFNKDLKPYDYDPKKATDLIEKAGFKKNDKGIYEKDGQPLKVVYYATKGSPIVEGIALAAQKDWGAIGVDVQLEIVDFNTVLKSMREGDFNITFSGIAFSVDPYTSFAAFDSKNIQKDDKGFNQGSNSSRFSNPEVDALLAKGMATIDLNERKQIYQQAEKLIMDAAPVNPIYVNLWTDFVKKEVKGVTVANGYGMSLSRFMSQYYVQEK